MSAPHATHPDHPDRIDLRSDTFTQPTDAMRHAMANAAVGDDLFSEDPSTERLEATAARLLGKEAALFVPSGTMANLIAVLSHTEGRGTEILCDRKAHVLNYESGGLSRLAHCHANPIDAPRGILTPDLLQAHLRADFFVYPRQGLVTFENTVNDHGGVCLSPDQVEAIADFTQRHGLPLHCDGARIFHAAVAQSVPASKLVDPCDTIMFCVSKGLSAPVGSLLCGDEATIERAKAYRKMVGGAMRQSGHMAAAAQVALDTMVDRLHEDHRNARRLAEAAAEAGLGCDPDAHPTNIVIINGAPKGLSGPQMVEALAGSGVLAMSLGPDSIRLVTHRHITTEKTQRAEEALHAAAKSA